MSPPSIGFSSFPSVESLCFDQWSVFGVMEGPQGGGGGRGIKRVSQMAALCLVGQHSCFRVAYSRMFDWASQSQKGKLCNIVFGWASPLDWRGFAVVCLIGRRVGTICNVVFDWALVTRFLLSPYTLCLRFLVCTPTFQSSPPTL